MTVISENNIKPPYLSIIIPAFNEAERLPETLRKIAAYALSLDYPTEVIVVDNLSSDATKNIILDFHSSYPFIRYLCGTVPGKGGAVRAGIMKGRGDYLLICDADLAVPIEEVCKFLPPRLVEYDIAIGSREAAEAVRYGEPFYRHLMGRVFNLIVRALLLPGIRDTQCGFKCFRRDVARELFSLGIIDGWSFDVEILHLSRLKGYRVVEVSVDWYFGEKSKVSPVRDTIGMLKEILVIKRNWKGKL